jgi:hypothetical protein
MPISDEKMAKGAAGMRAIFDAAPNAATFSRDNAFTVHWSRTGVGFGSFGFYIGDDDKVHIANEMMGKDDIKAILAILVDEAVLDDVREPKR